MTTKNVKLFPVRKDDWELVLPNIKIEELNGGELRLTFLGDTAKRDNVAAWLWDAGSDFYTICLRAEEVKLKDGDKGYGNPDVPQIRLENPVLESLGKLRLVQSQHILESYSMIFKKI